MRKLTLLTFLALTLAIPVQAEQRDQSYVSYDDGGTIVRQGEDGRQIDARVNMPVFPGDEVVTNRRGRAEIRLSDGNVIGIDRASAVRFRSILDSYEGDSSESIVELRYGKLAVYRTNDGREYVRVDTSSASYFATNEAIFSVETDSAGKDRLAVFDGSVEVRTPDRNTRVRAGEAANIDDRGLYGLIRDDQNDADDFERWFVRRAERYGGANSRYLDRSLAYYDDDLSRNGSWVYVSSFGWGWRPYASAGWRPYYNGHWMRSRYGTLVWVSYDPWGWVPYHYGRWSYDPYYGWFWLPGTGYAPAWVYWMYGPGYVGWAPAGWYDCYRPYYNWAYRPYTGHGIDFGFGFHGRVRVGEIDLRPWTFVDSNTIVSTRVDRAALTTDVIRGRLARDNGGFATVSNGPARMINERLADPTKTINRRWVGTDTGAETGAGGIRTGGIGDVTPFFRRDPELAGTIRDRIIRTRPSDGAPASTRVGGGNVGSSGGGVAPIGGGSVAPIGGGNVAPIGGGSVAPISGGSVAPIGGSTGGDRVTRGSTPRGESGSGGGRINRGETRPYERAVPPRDSSRDNTDTPRTVAPTWRDRIDRTQRPPRSVEPAAPAPTPVPDAPVSQAPEPTRDNSWRDRAVRNGDQFTGRAGGGAVRIERPRSTDGDRGRSDVPRRVIDGIGGARIAPRDPGRVSAPPPSSSGSRGSSGASSAPPPAPRSESAPRSHDGGGGKIKRDH